MAAEESDYAVGIWAPSGNFGFTAMGAQGRSDGKTTYKITGICMHGTGGLMPGCLDWLRNPASKASVTYLVSRDGLTRQLVREENVAWGNGGVEAPSVYLNGPDPNLFTISIEHEMPNGNTGTLTPAQQAASIALIADIRRRHGPLPLIPHSAIAPQSRAHCPGAAFPLSLIDKVAQPPLSVTPTRPWSAIYLQRDARWAGHQLGSAPNATIGDVGCYLTALAVMANYYGTPVTPGLLNDLLTLRKIYEQGDLMPDNALQQAYPGMTMQAVHDYTGTPADLGILGPVAADPTLTAILEVDFDAGLGNGVASHFVTFDHMAGQRVYVLDPWYGDGVHVDDVAWHFGQPEVTIQKVVIYKGTPAAPNPVPTPKPTPTKVLITKDMDARSKPQQGAVIQPVQVVHKGATLQLTGRFTTNWLEVIAGGNHVWIARKNTKEVV